MTFPNAEIDCASTYTALTLYLAARKAKNMRRLEGREVSKVGI
jgi:hypothetical protein